MMKIDIHTLIRGYFNATLSVQQEDLLKQMLVETKEDTDDIREAKAVMGLFATNRKLTGKSLNTQKPKSAWGKLKYAAVLATGFLINIFVGSDD